MEYQTMSLANRLLQKIECLPTLKDKYQRNILLGDLKKIAYRIDVLRNKYEHSEQGRIKAEATLIKYINEGNLRKNGYERIHKYMGNTAISATQ